ncbi:MAG: gamma-glutamylcyclotransferase [Rhodobacteraceae bacterium]|nr:gamma-glutamylcyclotransferase [Paracoccaceae bacterium]
MRQLFFYGTLRDMGVLSAVLGRDSAAISMRKAVLPGYRASAVRGQDFPFAVAAKGATAEGLLVSGLGQDDIDRLIYYEGSYLYDLVEVQVDCDGKPERAEVFLSDHQGWTPEGLWSLPAWQAKDQGLAAEAAREVMAHYGQRGSDEVYRRYDSIRIRAHSRLLARAAAPQRLRQDHAADDIRISATRRPYFSFFALEEHDVSYRGFDGSFSPTVERAVFLAADAVTVLPYDPLNDLVMLVEQFRAGPMGRGDPNPWCLEPIAGRVDANESYEQTARREAIEEAGLKLQRLEKVASYYSSPGAVSEYLMSYIGLCDLAGRTEAVHGMADEVEDIRSFVVPFATFQRALDAGEFDNGPLLISAHWLVRHRARLRRSGPSA